MHNTLVAPTVAPAAVLSSAVWFSCHVPSTHNTLVAPTVAPAAVLSSAVWFSCHVPSTHNTLVAPTVAPAAVLSSAVRTAYGNLPIINCLEIKLKI